MTILLVDDQQTVLTALQNMLDWSAFGIDRVFISTSVLHAKEILEKHEVNILVTDIEMPIENGLELIQYIRNRRLDIYCIILTSHADFEYAKAAIDLGVSAFLLQPIQKSELAHQIIDAVNTVSSRMNHMLTLSDFSSTRNAIIRDHFENYLPDKKDSYNGTVLFLCNLISTWFSLPKSAINIIPTIQEMVSTIFYGDENQAVSYYLDNSNYISVVPIIGNTEILSLIKKLNNQLASLLKCELTTAYLLSDASQMKNSIETLTEFALNQEEKMFSSSENHSLVLQLSPITEDVKSSERKKNNRYIREIHSFITENITQPISRQQVSDHLHISADYLSHIVRIFENSSFTELVTKIKMEKARELLRTTDMAVGEVARETGYDNFGYFSRIYKEIFGKSPRDDRYEE